MSKERKERQLSPEELKELEHDMHAAFERWTLSHMGEEDSPIGLLPYDPMYPEQSIEEHVTSAEIPGIDNWRLWHKLVLPEKAALLYMREVSLAKALGGRALAREIVYDFRNTPAYTDAPEVSLTDEHKRLLSAGKNIATILPHEYRADIGIVPGGKAIAMGELKYIYENNWQMINKLMTRQTYKDKPITASTRKVGRIAWVIPPGKSMKVYGVPRKALWYVSKNGTKSLSDSLEDPSQGVDLAVAPTGARMLKIEDDSGELLGWKFPPIEAAARNMLDSFDVALPVGFAKRSNIASWDIGSFIRNPRKPELSPEENGMLFMDMVMIDLKEKMEKLLGKPVEYERLIPAVTLGPVAVGSEVTIQP